MLLNFVRRTAVLSLRYASTATPKERWDLYVGVVIERLPVVSRNLNDIETEFMSTLSQIEFENSLKSDHEMRKEKDKKQQELIKSGRVDVELDSEKNLQTAQDFQDANADELAKFKMMPRETEDDNKNNLKSLNRKLGDTLMLVCSHEVNKNEVLLLPQAKWNEGETLRQTAERIVQDKFGSDLLVHFYGNAPCGFYKYKYKPSDKKDSIGLKTFFYRAAYKSGEVKNTKFEWLNEEELKGKVRGSYYKSVSHFMFS